MAQDRLSVVKLPIYGAGSTLSFSDTAATSSVLSGAASGVWIWADKAFCVRVGVGVTATATDFPVPAGIVVWVPVPDNATGPSVVSAIRIAENGTAYFIPGI